MDELFEKFARGEIPNIIELMTAISEIADYWPTNVCADCRSCQDSEPAQPTTPGRRIISSRICRPETILNLGGATLTT